MALIRPVSKYEVDLALNDCSSDNAPGLDGLNAGVLKYLWSSIQQGMMDCISNFLEKGTFPAGINSSFITLIPKVSFPTEIKDFRPISLINCSLKVISKLLTNRLVMVMSYIISANQTGFMKGRQISEGILITNEVVHLIKKKDINGVVLKLDFEKAFDSVDWEFLFEALEALGFHSKWIFWIKSLFDTMKASILVNGSPTPEFFPHKGLRQGDPLSPFLFNIVGEVFHLLMEAAKEKGLIKGVEISPRINNFTHL